MRIEGGQQLARLSKRMKEAADKELQRSTRKRLRAAVQPLLAEVKREAAVNSQHVAAAIVATFRYGGDVASAGIKAQRSRMPAGKENLPELMEFGSKGSGGRFIRHPVFGGEVRVNQPIRPYFFRNAREATPKVQAAMGEVLADVERTIT
jgi:hypothetical protein